MVDMAMAVFWAIVPHVRSTHLNLIQSGARADTFSIFEKRLEWAKFTEVAVMPGEMCWLPRLGGGGEKILHLRVQRHEPWKPYTAFPQYSVPDYRVPKGSKGWASYQRLRDQNWVLVPSPDTVSNAQTFGLVQET